jgi:hypothetical protein
MLSGSYAIFALSNHTTFSQTQTGATVPLSMINPTPRPRLTGAMLECSAFF